MPYEVLMIYWLKFVKSRKYLNPFVDEYYCGCPGAFYWQHHYMSLHVSSSLKDDQSVVFWSHDSLLNQFRGTKEF